MGRILYRAAAMTPVKVAEFPDAAIVYMGDSWPS